VNDSADEEMLSFFDKIKVRPILKSNMYGMQRKQNFLRFVFDRLLKNFFKFLVKLNISDSKIEIFKIKFSSGFLKSAIKELESLNFHEKDIVLVFPTLDALGFRMIRCLAQKNYTKVIRVCVRVTGAEKRGVFSVLKSENELIQIKSSSNFELNIGYEVDSYRQKFSSRELEFPNLYWAPMPTIERNLEWYIENTNSDPRLQLGFLGSARSGKGFDDIPTILDMLKLKKVPFHAFIQKPIFEWEKSNETIASINNFHSQNVTWLAGGISRNQIDEIIYTSDVLFLPYDCEQYKYAGSGLLFIASDYFIPVITNDQVAFAWDITTFNIGLTYENFQAAADKLINFSKNSFSKNFREYNYQRNLANEKFLGLKP